MMPGNYYLGSCVVVWYLVFFIVCIHTERTLLAFPGKGKLHVKLSKESTNSHIIHTFLTGWE